MKMNTLFLRIFAFLIFAGSLSADQVFPGPDWVDKPDPLASVDAEVGGEIRLFGYSYPKSFNYLLDNNTLSSDIFTAMYDTLLASDPITMENTPLLAKKWSISDDRKTFTFWIDKRARWSDGRPITAHDVKWTYDTIMNPTNMTGVHKISMEKFDTPTVIDEYTIQFHAKTIHWKNLLAAGSIYVLPKHVFENRDFNKINFEFPVVSGLYRLGKINEGISAKLERRNNWWLSGAKRFQNMGNFQTITFRFYEDRENAFEAFKKGNIDVFSLNIRKWIKETKGTPFIKNWIIRQKVYNKQSVGLFGISMNMRRPPFDDVRVRQAIAHLINRQEMNRRIMYNQGTMFTSYFQTMYSESNPCKNPVYDFNKITAAKLLDESGWLVNPETGFREKNGKPLSFEFFTHAASLQKYLVIISEDFKTAGIDMKIHVGDWAGWLKEVAGEYNFDMTWANWNTPIAQFTDPESLWHSKEADRKNANNYTGFKDKKVDSLIEELKGVFDVKKRLKMLAELDAILAERSPYALLWYEDFDRIAYWNKFGTPTTVLSKYGGARDFGTYTYWWYDQDSAADLKEAQEKDEFLPGRQPVIIFEEVFK